MEQMEIFGVTLYALIAVSKNIYIYIFLFIYFFFQRQCIVRTLWLKSDKLLFFGGDRKIFVVINLGIVCLSVPCGASLLLFVAGRAETSVRSCLSAGCLPQQFIDPSVLTSPLDSV